jgi:hypothetical protein
MVKVLEIWGRCFRLGAWSEFLLSGKPVKRKRGGVDLRGNFEYTFKS